MTSKSIVIPIMWYLCLSCCERRGTYWMSAAAAWTAKLPVSKQQRRLQTVPQRHGTISTELFARTRGRTTNLMTSSHHAFRLLQTVDETVYARTGTSLHGTEYEISDPADDGYNYMPDIDHLKQEFPVGSKIQVEVLSFGPLGASCDIIGKGHDANDLIPETEPALGQGIIYQNEIKYYRQGRGGVDVVIGEVLPAYVERFRDQDGKVDISLRPAGGKAKAEDVAERILDKMEGCGGSIPIGDKSSPYDIAAVLPGVSKGSFKKAVAALYRQKKVRPGPQSIVAYTEDDE